MFLYETVTSSGSPGEGQVHLGNEEAFHLLIFRQDELLSRGVHFCPRLETEPSIIRHTFNFCA